MPRCTQRSPWAARTTRSDLQPQVPSRHSDTGTGSLIPLLASAGVIIAEMRTRGTDEAGMEPSARH
jgi:hypothetical protein